MTKSRALLVAPLALLAIACAEPEIQPPSDLAREVAAYAVSSYADSALATLAEVIEFRTVAREGVEAGDHPEVRAMTAYLEEKANAWGLDFADHGAMVVISLGDAEERLGVITHGDVQPADSTKWAESPFTLDTLSEPGLLLGRGVEDDKGPIVTALYAMRALVDREVELERRIELLVSYTEESDWAPLQAFLAENPPPELNVALDSEYPVVIAEKAWNAIHLTIADGDESSESGPWLESIIGGAFLSQIPEDARAIIRNSTPELEESLTEAGAAETAVAFTFNAEGETLTVAARGLAAHSSKPWDGRNAVTHLAALLGNADWPPTPAAHMVRLINDLVGTGDYAERFGDVAHAHEFMGRLTLSLTTLGTDDDGRPVAGINIRAPVGRTGNDLESRVRAAVESWQQETGIGVEISATVGDSYYLRDAPHVPVLLGIFRAYTGIEDAEPISIGGGTNARLVPNGVNFGPAMPGAPYTGHSEHEFMTRDQLKLNLEMYTAMLVELAGVD